MKWIARLLIMLLLALPVEEDSVPSYYINHNGSTEGCGAYITSNGETWGNKPHPPREVIEIFGDLLAPEEMVGGPHGLSWFGWGDASERFCPPQSIFVIYPDGSINDCKSPIPEEDYRAIMAGETDIRVYYYSREEYVEDAQMVAAAFGTLCAMARVINQLSDG